LLPSDSLKDILHRPGLSKADRLLFCLAVDVKKPKSVQEIKSLCIQGGLNKAKKWNISQMLGRSKGYAVRTPDGWELTSDGKIHVSTLAGPLIKPVVTKVASSLRTHLSKIANAQTAAFVEEAILCFESGYKRAAAVLSWAGAVSLLYDHVIKSELQAFNTEAKKRFPKWKAAKKESGLAKMREYDFLQVLEAISVIGKNEKEELEQCLKFRNACGHPSTLKIGETRVASHIETLILNVYSQF